MKRILALALCLMALCPAALAETYPIYMYDMGECPDYYMLIRDDGTPLTPEGAYNNIYEITPSDTPEAEKLYGAISNDVGIAYTPEKAEAMRYDFVDSPVALMDARGALVTGFDYSVLDYANGYVLFTLPGEEHLTGAMDAQGHVVMAAEYAALKPQGDGWLALKAVGEDRYALVRIAADGSVRELGLHTDNCYFNVDPEGVCVMSGMEEYGGQWVFIGPDGGVMFDRGFDYADDFQGDYAVVEERERCGVIDRTGAFAAPPEYDYIQWEPGKPCIAVKGAAYDVYDPESFERLASFDFASAGDVGVSALTADLVGVTVDDKSRVYTTQGELLLEASGGESIQMYGYGVKTNRLIGESGSWPDDRARLIDLEGNVVSGDYQFINDGVWRDGHGRYITGTFRIYKNADGENSVEWNSYRYGLIDDDGKQLLPQVYDGLRVLSFDRFWAVQGNVRGMIDAEGKWYCTFSEYEALMD